jgi:hypothetical protein
MLKIIKKREELSDYVCESGNFAYLAVDKCRSSVFKAAFFEEGHPPCSREEARKAITRLAVIQDPRDRIISAWRINWPKVSWEDWWLEISKNPWLDASTSPYSSILTSDSTDLFALEDIAVWWPLIRRRFPSTATFEYPVSARKIIHKKLPKIVLDSFKDIERVYGSDLEMWRKCRLP